jgi:phage terminase large subunit-like protein
MARKDNRNRFATYYSTPELRAGYHKHLDFFRLGKEFNERMLAGGNRSGKTVAGGYELTCHLTGRYPDWWEGKFFPHAIDAWTAGDTGKSVRDIMQTLLCGKPGDLEAYGTGMIPGELLGRHTVKHGLADAFESVFVKHEPTGDWSSLQFKSFDQGRDAFQGTARHVIHLDEECPMDVYEESLLRTMTVDGIVYVTATPLQGLTDLMLAFMPEFNPVAK